MLESGADVSDNAARAHDNAAHHAKLALNLIAKQFVAGRDKVVIHLFLSRSKNNLLLKERLPNDNVVFVAEMAVKYREPPFHTFDREYVQERLVAVKPWYPLPDEPASMLVTFELTEGHALYDLRTIYLAFRSIVGLKFEKEIVEGLAVAKHSIYDLAWPGITSFARELTRLHTYEKYYLG